MSSFSALRTGLSRLGSGISSGPLGTIGAGIKDQPLGVGVGGADIGFSLGMPAFASGIGGVTRAFGINQSRTAGGLLMDSPEAMLQMQMASTASGQRRLNIARKTQQKYEMLQSRMGQSLARLAAVSPQKYQEVMAGRILPQGAVVLGGTPRVDLMEDLALRMASSPNSIPGAPAQPSVMDLI